MITTIHNGLVLDTERMEILGERYVTVEGDRIVDVDAAEPKVNADRVIEARGRFVLPGFIDAHVHHLITTMDFPKLARMSPVEVALGMARLAEAMVRRGFTTVRDTGGDVGGLVQAIEAGLCDGPRIVRAGRVLSQTGGHGDIQPEDGEICACRAHTSAFAHVVDGPDAVRQAVRRELRAGSSFIKIMTSGGVASPTDPFDCVQYTDEEIRAATTATDHRHTYTTSHAYQPEAIRIAIENGVRCIEHGNLVDPSTAARMAELEVTMVPTLVTYKAMAEIGAMVGLPARNIEKNEGVFDRGLESVGIARAAGVTLGFGTDLLGEAQPWQNREFAIRAELEPAADVLRSVYRVNARLCGLEEEVGRLVPGASADIVIGNADPLEDLAAYSRPEETLAAVVCRGRVIVDRL